MRLWHWYSCIFWGQVRENEKKYFPPPIKKMYITFTMQTYVWSFIYPCLSPSIKSEHGSLVSQGSNINVKKIHTGPHITWIWNSQKCLFQHNSWNFWVEISTTTSTWSLLLPPTHHIRVPFIKLLCKSVSSQLEPTKTHTGNLQPAFTVCKSKHPLFKTTVASFLTTLSNAALKVCVCSIQPHSLKTLFNIILTSISTSSVSLLSRFSNQRLVYTS